MDLLPPLSAVTEIWRSASKPATRHVGCRRRRTPVTRRSAFRQKRGPRNTRATRTGARSVSANDPVGIEHGTIGVIGRDGVMYEVTTFRRDVETFGRHAVVEFADTIEEDLARRAFTFNALAWNLETTDVYDPYNGLDDLCVVCRRRCKAADRFAEDYLRVLRGIRFAGQFQSFALMMTRGARSSPHRTSRNFRASAFAKS